MKILISLLGLLISVNGHAAPLESEELKNTQCVSVEMPSMQFKFRSSTRQLQLIEVKAVGDSFQMQAAVFAKAKRAILSAVDYQTFRLPRPVSDVVHSQTDSNTNFRLLGNQLLSGGKYSAISLNYVGQSAPFPAVFSVFENVPLRGLVITHLNCY